MLYGTLCGVVLHLLRARQAQEGVWPHLCFDLSACLSVPLNRPASLQPSLPRTHPDRRPIYRPCLSRRSRRLPLGVTAQPVLAPVPETSGSADAELRLVIFPGFRLRGIELYVQHLRQGGALPNGAVASESRSPALRQRSLAPGKHHRRGSLPGEACKLVNELADCCSRSDRGEANGEHGAAYARSARAFVSRLLKEGYVHDQLFTRMWASSPALRAGAGWSQNVCLPAARLRSCSPPEDRRRMTGAQAGHPLLLWDTGLQVSELCSLRLVMWTVLEEPDRARKKGARPHLPLSEDDGAPCVLSDEYRLTPTWEPACQRRGPALAY